MKKYFLASVFCFLFFQANAQLRGSYCRGVTFSSTCLTFLNDTEFEYELFDCTSHRAGKGTYKLTRKNLVLTFTKPKPPAPTCSVIISETPSQGDSVRF